MKKVFLILSLSLLTFGSVLAQMQNSDPILAMNVTLETIGADTAVNGSALPFDSILTEAKMKLVLTDTVGIARIFVKFGDSPNSGNLFTQTFDYDAVNANYSRTDYNVLISLGQYYGLTSYYSSVQIQRANGDFTDTIPFSR